MAVRRRPHHVVLSIGQFDCPHDMAAGFFHRERAKRDHFYDLISQGTYYHIRFIGSESLNQTYIQREVN